eukprot:12136028-Heterocapsa_arctica.AAC.1
MVCTCTTAAGSAAVPAGTTAGVVSTAASVVLAAAGTHTSPAVPTPAGTAGAAPIASSGYPACVSGNTGEAGDGSAASP